MVRKAIKLPSRSKLSKSPKSRGGAARKDANGARQNVTPHTGADFYAFREHFAASLRLTGWRVAKSLDHLLQQINALAPTRDIDSDGSIGDEVHQGESSDHNPWVTDNSGQHVVTARDITHDPASGCDCNAITSALVASRDPRIKYIIWNNRIVSATVSPWRWRAYAGVNPHDHHFHVSVVTDENQYDNERDWVIV
jgi:hypothetical protein